MPFPKSRIQNQQGQDQNSRLSTISHLVTSALEQNDHGVACWVNHHLSQNRPGSVCTKVHLVKAMVFPIVMYGCESWAIQKAERQRTDAFELWCWTLESPLDSKNIQPVHSKGDQS